MNKMNKIKKKNKGLLASCLVLLAFALIIGIACRYMFSSEKPVQSSRTSDEWTGILDSGFEFSYDDVPEYKSEPYVLINNNMPGFKSYEITEKSYEKYGELDAFGRCTVCVANIGRDIMPEPGEKRGEISSVKPTGWKSVKYDIVDGKYLYNRCHLIGYQLSAENANKSNLITGTRYMNVDGQLPFENMVADYVKETENHVLYRVTPVFVNDELVARGVLMEAVSVEDKGQGICFNVFCYNVQPGISIDYATGKSSLIK